MALLLVFLLCAAIVPLMATGASAAGSDLRGFLGSPAAAQGDGTHHLGFQLAPQASYATAPSAPGTYGGAVLGTSADLSSQLPPVGNQGQQGSCVAWATSYYYKTWSEKQEHTGWNLANSQDEFSPSFVYNQINGGQDYGSSFTDAFNLLETKGDVDIAEFPYSQSNYTNQPSAAQLEAAKPYRIPSGWYSFWNQYSDGPYSPPNSITNAKSWLASGKPLVMGIPVYNDFPNYGGNPRSTYYVYNGTAPMAGGHGVCICGYDDNINPGGVDADHRGGFKMVNSWGSGWNGNGYVYLSYDFVKRYVWEAWVMADNGPDTPQITSLGSSGGAVGSSVQINGQNFGSLRRNARVTFNGTPAIQVTFTDARVTATVPKGATSGSVVVSDWEGTASNGVAFTVSGSGPAPTSTTVTSVTPGQADNSGSAALSVDGTNFASGCQVTMEKSGSATIEASGETLVNSGMVNCNVDLTDVAPGAWDVVVTNPDSSSGKLGGGFTVTKSGGAGDTYEPNDSIAEAYGPLQSGVTYQSYVWTDSDEDFYQIAVPQAATGLVATLRNIPAGCDFDLYLFDSQSELIESSTASGNAPETIDVSGLSAGTYYLQVTPWTGSSQTQPYSLCYTATYMPKISNINPQGGPKGASITINGSNFGATRGTSYVAMDSLVLAASDYASWTDSAITFKVPPDANGTPSLSVTTKGGTSNAVPFAVDPLVATYTPSTGMPGTTVAIIGSGFGNNMIPSGGAGSRDATSCVCFNGTPATSYKSWTNTKIVCEVPDGASAGPITVKTSSGTSGKTGTFVVMQSACPTWYLAEGTTAWGFSTYITIENPNANAVTADITYMPAGKPNVTEAVSLPPSSQTTLTNNHLVSVMGGPDDFSTKVESTDATKTIAVDRTTVWTGKGAPSEEAHCSIGVTAPATTWYLPEGSSKWGFETWLLIQNPGNTDAVCTITYMIDGQGPKVVTHPVPKASRSTFNMEADIGQQDASIEVASNTPVIPERAMYRNNRREGDDSIGTTTPASDYFLAEGTTGYGFTTYVLVQNPNSTPTDITLTYMTSSGPRTQPTFTMEPDSRKTIRVNDVAGMANTDFSIQAHGSEPIIAERSMYWGAGTTLGEACHDSIGMASGHENFYLPDGQTSEGRQTYTLVQNPNAVPVNVQITYMTPSGTGNVSWTESVPAKARKTFNMADKVINGRAAVKVTCTSSGKKIIVERAMYWNNRGAGTDTIGGYRD